MISSIAELDTEVALGVLARAALASEDEANPDASYRLPNEKVLRELVFGEVRQSLGIAGGDDSREAYYRLGEALDQEIAQIAGQVDRDAVLKKLALHGDVPSDLYQVEIIENVKEFYIKNWVNEEQLIRRTILEFDREQHFGPGESEGRPEMFSLFSKFYVDKFPARSFTMLVAAHREGMKLFVHQAWRIYADVIPLDGVTDLVDMLRRFSDKFGLEFLLNGVKSKFIVDSLVSSDQGLPRNIQVLPVQGYDGKGRRVEKEFQFTITDFQSRRSDGTLHMSLTIAINLTAYAAYLEEHSWRQSAVS